MKLTRAQADEIRARRAAGEKRSALALEYGVTERSITRVAQHCTWRAIRSRTVGELANGAVLDDDTVREIRRRTAAGESAYSIARDVREVSRTQVWRIATGQQRKRCARPIELRAVA